MRDFTDRIILRIKPEHRKLIEKKMKQTGIINMSAYIRKMAIDGYIIRLDTSDLREISRLLSINSNNLNQIAKRANETGSIYIKDINELKDQQEEIHAALRKVYESFISIYDNEHRHIQKNIWKERHIYVMRRSELKRGSRGLGAQPSDKLSVLVRTSTLLAQNKYTLSKIWSAVWGKSKNGLKRYKRIIRISERIDK